jgi:NFACT N-terminal and middle domains
MQRFSSVDVHVMARELHKKLRGLRVTKVFSLNPQTLLLRLQAPEQRLELLIEAGVRVHTTAFDREKPPAPNPFAIKLRKALLGKRCAHVRQLGVDRVLELAVGEEGRYRNYLLVELYARGNIVLCDQNYEAIAVRRTFRDESTGIEVRFLLSALMWLCLVLFSVELLNSLLLELLKFRYALEPSNFVNSDQILLGVRWGFGAGDCGGFPSFFLVFRLFVFFWS